MSVLLKTLCASGGGGAGADVLDYPSTLDIGDNISATITFENVSADQSGCAVSVAIGAPFTVSASTFGPLAPAGTATLTVSASASGAQSGTLTATGSDGPISIPVTSALSVPIPTAWYHADDIGIANGATVTSWADRRGSYNIVTTAGSSGNITYNTTGVGGSPAVNFPTARWFTFPAGLRTALNSAGAITVVVRGLCNNVAQYGGFIGTSTNGDQFFSLSNIQYANIASATRLDYAYTTAEATASHVWAATGTAGAQQYLRDNVSKGTSANAFSLAATLTLGAWYRGGVAEGMDGRIREVRIYDRVLTGAELTAVYNQM